MVDKESSDISNPAKNVPAKLTRTIENLVFEGGGVKGVGYAGAVEVLERYGIVPKRVAGASAGAIAALLLGLGYDSKSLATLMTTIDLASFQDSPRWTPLGKGIDVYKHYGIYRGDEFEKWVKERLKEATGNSDITFRGLQELRLKKNQRAFKDMYFIGANLSTSYYEIFSHEHTADMPIYLAVRISMALPLFFTPKRYGKHGDLYVDGGLLNNYPLTIFDHEGEENLATLGFRLDPSEEISVQRDQKEPTRCKIDSLSSYAKALFAATSNVGNNYSRLQDEYFRTVYIDTKDISTTEFALSLERQQMLIKEGREATEKFIKTYLLTVTQTGQHPARLSNRQRFAKIDRQHLYAKAKGISVRKIRESTIVQLVFDSADSNKIEKYFDRLKCQPSVREVSYGGLANQSGDSVLAFSGQDQLYSEIKHWLEKHKAQGKSLGNPIDSSSWIKVQHYQRPTHTVQLRPSPVASQGKRLYEAVQKNDTTQISRLLDEGVTLNYQDQYGQTALHVAVENHQVEIVKLLLEKIQFTSYIDTADHKGETALHRLMANNDDDKKREILTLLLQKGAGLEVRNKFGSTPLHRATFWGRLATVKALVEAGANRNAKDNEGLTVLEIAGQSGRGQCQEIIAYLKQEAEQEQTITQQWAATVKKGPGL